MRKNENKGGPRGAPPMHASFVMCSSVPVLFMFLHFRSLIMQLHVNIITIYVIYFYHLLRVMITYYPFHSTFISSLINFHLLIRNLLTLILDFLTFQVSRLITNPTGGDKLKKSSLQLSDCLGKKNFSFDDPDAIILIISKLMISN